MGFSRIFRKRRPSMVELLDQLDVFEEQAELIDQPKGQVRICTRDRSELRVVMMAGAGGEDERDELLVCMVCDTCGSKYVELAGLDS